MNGRTCAAGRCTPAWQALSTANAPSTRSRHAAAIVGSKYFVFGGTPGNNAALTSGAAYDLNTNNWAPIPELKSARCAHRAVSTGTSVLTFGGLSDCSNGTTIGPGLEEFTPAGSGGQWLAISGGQAPGARYNFGAFWTGTGMFIIGGGSNTVPNLADSALYMPGTGWSATTCTLAACGGRTAPVLFMRSGLVYSGWGGFPTWDATGLTYDPQGKTWSTWTAPADPDMRTNTLNADDGRRIFFVGSTRVAILDIQTLSWLSDDTSPLPVGFCGTDYAAAWSGSEVVVWGGQCSNGVSTVGGRYQPAAPGM